MKINEIYKCKDCKYCDEISFFGLFKRYFCTYGDPYCTVQIKNPGIIHPGCVLDDIFIDYERRK